jgi:uncharacterized small protein (DUF1192 family)
LENKNKTIEERVKDLEEKINKPKFTSFFSNNYKAADPNINEIDKLRNRVKLLEDEIKRMKK